ncbi:MAG TPA: hypothetical protein VME20_08925 [Acidimicrobiales bacterium]|nr:hypothetical protein [Acidimicrobiales bacterium]
MTYRAFGRPPRSRTCGLRVFPVPVLAVLAVLGQGLAIGTTVSAQASSAQVPQAWQLQHVPSPPGSDLESVSCPTVTDCVAVGAEETTSGPALSVVESWSPRGWSLTKTPQPSLIAGGASLVSVSCASGASCVAVGGDGTFSSDGYQFSDVLEAGTWHVMPTAKVNAAIPGSVLLSSVSCWEPTGCDAVGLYTSRGPGGAGEPVVETFNGKTWSLAKTPAFADGASLDSISCLPATVPDLCVAVGSKFSSTSVPQTSLPLVELGNGSSFQVVAVPAPPGAQTSTLTSVSCPQPSSCVAVGTDQAGSDSPSRSFSEVEELHRWGVVPPAPPPADDGQDFELSGVSCPVTISACVAVGAAGTMGAGATGSRTLAEAEELSPGSGRSPGTSLGEWHVTATHAPQLSGFEAVSCPLSYSLNTVTCTAVGYFQPGQHRRTQAMAART